METQKYQYAIVIGRMQPYHKAHHELLTHALKIGEKAIIILGSARKSPDVKNPFTPQRRERMIRQCFPEATQSRLIFKAVRDYPYNENFWIAEIQNAVQSVIEDGYLANANPDDEFQHVKDLNKIKITLTGFLKDSSSYYLKHFPQWKFEEFYRTDEMSRTLAGTDVRQLYFNEDERWESLVPSPVVYQLREFHGSEIFKKLQAEFKYIQQYKKDSKFSGLPFEPTFNTTDAVVTCMGHLLVVRRGHQPGKGLIGLPGGFLAKGHRQIDNMIKELKEETKIHVPDQVLRGSIKDKEIFDDPDRSQRGRTITVAFHIELPSSLEKGLPLVRGGDDADKAFWLPISSLGEKEEEFFEDHVHIARHFLGLV